MEAFSESFNEKRTTAKRTVAKRMLYTKPEPKSKEVCHQKSSNGGTQAVSYIYIYVQEV